MPERLEVIAIIPARGGSKGLSDKNILPLLGHPLIAYSIRAAQLTPQVTRVVVNTDSEKIAEIAHAYGAEVPFIRPAELAGDFSTDLEVFQHALNWHKTHENYSPDLVLQLRPTSPVRFADEIEHCINLLWQHPDVDSLRGVTPSPNTPYKMWWVDAPDQPMRPLLYLAGVDEPYNMPRQKLPQTYWQTGTIDILRPQVVLEQNSMSGKNILPFLIDSQFAIDIDDLQSFEKAAQVISANNCIKW